MTEWTAELSEEICKELADDFASERIIEGPGGNPTRLLLEFLVDRVSSVKIEVFANEHPPPHFRIKYQNETANFSIKNCRCLNSSGRNIMRYEKNIRCWWEGGGKEKLIKKWNKSRPSDCPVGKYRE